SIATLHTSSSKTRSRRCPSTSACGRSSPRRCGSPPRPADSPRRPLTARARAPRDRPPAAAETGLAEAGLVPLRDYLDRQVDSLSGGQRQRVALARALIGQPRLIVADEPTSMLDAPAKWAWLERLDALRKDHGLAVLLITHDMRQADAFCDRIVALRDGRLATAAAGTPPAAAACVGSSP